MSINYSSGSGEYKNWIIEEDNFKIENQAKFESIFSLGNGYMGLRASFEENYIGEKRGFFISGIFDKFTDEVTELPNLPDWINTDIYIDNEKMNLKDGKLYNYSRKLNLKEGILSREFLWEGNNGKMLKFHFERFISLANLHIGLLKINIESINFFGKIELTSGFDGRITNTGTQHLTEGTKRVIDNNLIYKPKTQQSNIQLGFGLKQRVYKNNQKIKSNNSKITEKRLLKESYIFNLESDDEVDIYKILSVYSSRDNEIKSNEEIENKVLDTLKDIGKDNYKTIKQRHKDKWHNLWDDMDIKISGNDFDQLAIRFAQFHLLQMTPAHDARISIPAKGLTGEGYKGHVFWDTESFIIPFYTYTFPEIAKKLLKYRYLTLDGAKKKAQDNGYKGAMFAWESADTGEETTPKFGSVDLLTGEQIRIKSGDTEHHITADIQYAINQYYEVTDDLNFMKAYGFETFIEAARFWASRVEYNADKDRYEINDIMGPDEYKEDVDQNAYTNYLVYWQFDKALRYLDFLKNSSGKYFQEFKKRINLNEKEVIEWQKKKEKIYLLKPDDNLVIEQFDGYHDLKEINLDNYRNSKAGEIFNDMGWEEILNTKVTKQADVIMLLYLLEDKFEQEVIKKNYNYYEPLTTHDSSLSQSVHAALASRVNELEKAYEHFKKAAKIDLGKDMQSSNEGVHAASFGGLWQSIVLGFGGVKIKEDGLYIDPKLPMKWNLISFNIIIRNNKLNINITKDKIIIKVLEFNNSLVIDINNNKFDIDEERKIIQKY
ncbi:MAG: glycoside hydrolase family 65 protein [Bacillota bacterium]